ncbi:testis-specific serine/threonine-protein kinase 2-like [Haliotis asinina]|uniref:testis-specific serine/threonine-protein kinase 2-like n=1 Tax=Haliotis asinina TaxID=109174 RepID=UPI0035320E32
MITRGRKRKMEAHIGGDNCKAHGSKTEPIPAKTQSVCLLSDAASGDSVCSPDVSHQFVTVVTDIDEGTTEVHTQTCDLGDIWTHRYPLPLSKYPARPIRTGNKYYDDIIPELSSLGFNPLQVIAKGRSGSVILAQDLHPSKLGKESEYKPVAIKLNSGRKRKQRGAKVDITEEMLIHQRLSHPNVVSFLDTLTIQGRAGLILEFCESGNLEQLLRAQDAKFITEPVARRYFKQILDALEYVHHSGYAHRDMCTQNILITNDNNIKIADFGHTVKFVTGDPLCEDSCGTMGFQAPEVVCKIPFNPRLADMWSLGAVLYTMTVGKLPFGRLRNEEMARSIKSLEFPPEKIMVLSNEIKDLLRGLLAYVAASRYSLNRSINCDWMNVRDERVYIGNFYLVRQPQKIFEGDREKDIKGNYKI